MVIRAGLFVIIDTNLALLTRVSDSQGALPSFAKDWRTGSPLHFCSPRHSVVVEQQGYDFCVFFHLIAKTFIQDKEKILILYGGCKMSVI